MKQQGRRVSLDNRYEKNPPNTKRVCRPSRWGNPYKLSDYSREESMRLYEEYLRNRLKENPEFLVPLKGKNLACYCDLDMDCHVEVILKYN